MKSAWRCGWSRYHIVISSNASTASTIIMCFMVAITYLFIPGVSAQTIAPSSSATPTFRPSVAPSISTQPTPAPTPRPSRSPTAKPSPNPTLTYSPTSLQQQNEANALCAFKQGITNWPGSCSSTTGWNCNGSTALSVLCGSGITPWSGVACDNAGSVNAFSRNNCQMQGTIWSQISILTKLTSLDLSYNVFTGSIPSELSTLSKLQNLYLNDNTLSSSIPSQISTLTHLYRLYLNNNMIISSIPAQLSALVNVLDLILANNKLFGQIPAQIGVLTNLNYLYLDSNKLTGPVGESICIPSLANGGGNLHLQNNNFSCIARCVGSKATSVVIGTKYYDTSTPRCGAPTSQPSQNPSSQPTSSPISPSAQPTNQPSSIPSSLPTGQPTMQPTTQPSSIPSSTPTCTLGSVRDGDSAFRCSPCPMGWYAPRNEACQKCAVGKYTNQEGSSECLQCAYPYTNNEKGSLECTMFSTSASNPLVVGGATYGFVGTVLVLFIALIWLTFRDLNQFLVVLLLMLFPALDLLSDIVYLATNLFFNGTLFSFSWFIIIISSTGLLKLLYELEAWPQKFIIPCPIFYLSPNLFWFTINHESTLMINYKPALPFEKYDSLLIWAVVIAAAIILSLLQFVTATIYLLWIVTHYFIIFPSMIIAAVLLYQTKLFSLNPVWNYWFSLWTGTTKTRKEGIFDKALFNEALFQEFVTETVPQIIIQTINNVLIGEFSTVAQFSFILSSIIAMDGIYQFLYYRLYLKTDFEDIPLMFNLKVDTSPSISSSSDSRGGSDESSRMMMKTANNNLRLTSTSSTIMSPHMRLQPLELIESDSKLSNSVSLFDDKEYQLLLVLMWLQYNANIPHNDASIALERLKKHKIVRLVDLCESYYRGDLINLSMNRTHLKLIVSALEEAVEEDKSLGAGKSMMNSMTMTMMTLKMKEKGGVKHNVDVESGSVVSNSNSTSNNIGIVMPGSIDQMVRHGAVLSFYVSGKMCPDYYWHISAFKGKPSNEKRNPNERKEEMIEGLVLNSAADEHHELSTKNKTAVETSSVKRKGKGGGEGGSVSSISAFTKTEMANKASKKNEFSYNSVSSAEGELEEEESQQHHKLPTNWNELVDPSSGRTYFYNSITRNILWERPRNNEDGDNDYDDDGGDNDDDGLVLSQSSKMEQDVKETSRNYLSSNSNEEPFKAEVRKKSNVIQYEAAVELAKRGGGAGGEGVRGGSGDISSISANTTTKKKSESINSAIESSKSVLPDNWKEFVDPSNGKSYYFNSITNESQWEFPRDEKKKEKEQGQDILSSRQSPSLLRKAKESETAVKQKLASKDTKSTTSIERISTKKGEEAHSSSSSSSSVPAVTTSKKKKKSETSSSSYTPANSTSESDNLTQLNTLPKEWKAKVDTATGKTYYYNSVTKKTQWKLPSADSAN